MSRANEPVTGFHIPAQSWNHGSSGGSQQAWTHKGLTIREHFALEIFKAKISAGRDSGKEGAAWAVISADALLATLADPNTPEFKWTGPVSGRPGS